MTEPMSKESTKLNANQEARAVLKVHILGVVQEQVSRWWQDLSESQRQEWMAIEMADRLNRGQIEEHDSRELMLDKRITPYFVVNRIEYELLWKDKVERTTATSR